MLSTGAECLDALLDGGLKAPVLLEVVGAPATGKTQLCHQLAVMVQLPRDRGGLNGRALYVDTEGTFRPERVVSMARYRGLDPEKTLENIIVVEARSVVNLVEAVLALEGFEVDLLLIDSIASPFIFPRSIGEARRSWGRLVALLKRLSKLNRITVVTNVERGGRASGDPYTAMWVDKRIKLTNQSGNRVDVSLTLPYSVKKCRLMISEEGVLQG
ncbi:MAG: hypothetical protein NZ954_03725 [Thermofilaceae archaeon]|nr:hypothetical protein [Thermofilaceae archaeon]